jgi:hypothetical protein
VINIDFGWLFSVGCVVHVSFYQRLLLNTLAPFICAALLCCTYAIARWRHKVQAVAVPVAVSNRSLRTLQRSDKLEQILAKHLLVFLAMTFLIYSTVSTAIFQTFACDAIADGDSCLRGDYRTSCNTATHTLYKVYSGITIVVYPIGIPVLYAYLLWHQRHQLNTASELFARSRDRGLSLRKTRFLWQTYKPELYYWEVVECIRRLLLTGTMVFIFPNTTAQPAIACLLAACAIVLVLWWSPHADLMDARIYVLGGSIVFLSLFLSLLVKVQSGADNTFQGSDTYSMTLVILNLLMVLAAVAQLMLVGKRAWLSKQTSFMGLRSTVTVSTSSVIGDGVIGTSTKDMSLQDTVMVPTYSTTSPMHRHSSATLLP